MRVATIFTGVAACTFPLAQAAHAQDAHANVRLRPDINIDNCSGAKKNWVHVGYVVSDVKYSNCIGNRGGHSYDNGAVTAFCGGNNSGHLFYHTANANVDWHFGHGTTYRTWNPDVGTSYISISGYAGTDACNPYR